MQSWKTTLMGFAPALIIAYTCYVEKRLPTPDELSIIIGVGGVGFMSKDFNVSHSK